MNGLEVRTLKRGELFLYGRLYDAFIGAAIKKMRERVTDLAVRYSLTPFLDICSGTGAQCGSIKLAAPAFETHGIDLDPGLVRYARRRVPGAVFVQADAAALPFPAASFRGVCVSFALHDKPAELRGRVLDEAKRVLAPGGYLVLLDFERPWNRRSRRWAFFVRLVERLAGREHYRNGRDFLAAGGLRSLIEKAGLHEVERTEFEAAGAALVLARPGQAGRQGDAD